ncbi:MAG: hypothetical protein LKE48_02705 [Solobacterium sp.]|nr:hypothetical protein [Solobacterium sp.]
MSCIDFKASPVDPVFVVTVSIASSTDFHEATAAVAAPTSGTVRPFVRVLDSPSDLLIAELRLVPAAFPAESPASVDAPVISSVIDACAPFIVGMIVIVACATSTISAIVFSPLFFKPLMKFGCW